MAKPNIPNQKKKYQELNSRLNRYVALVEQIYDALNLEAAKLIGITDYSPDSETPFRFSDYPQTNKAIADIQGQFVDDIRSVIYRGTTDEWRNSNEVHDLMANKVLQAYNAKIDKEKYKVLYQTNSDALKAFQNRKDKGFNVSAKLWQQSTIYKEELEAAISCAIQKGASAVTLSKQISKYLLDFPSLQKDYKEKFGSAEHLKDCEYRSIRLARSEINMAYRTAENERWKQMDFVVGYKIKLSGNHHEHDVCDTLAGKYPKDFVWTGWHPNDLCYKIPILKTEEEFWEWDGRSEATTESVNEVKDVPDSFKQWVGDNRMRIADATKRNTLPYFLKDNPEYINVKLSNAGKKNRIKSNKKRTNAKMQSPLDAFFKSINDVKNIDELQIVLDKQMSKMLGYDFSSSFMYSDDLGICKLYANRLVELFNEYRIDDSTKFKRFTTMTSKGNYGEVERSGYDVFSGTFERMEMRVSLNVDNDRLLKQSNFKSLCDKENFQVSTITHEFAHTLCNFNSLKNATPIRREFMAEIKMIENEYKLDVKNGKKNYIGGYAGRNTDEFMAEAFQEYKNKSNPGKYAQKVGSIIDKYFKK